MICILLLHQIKSTKSMSSAISSYLRFTIEILLTKTIIMTYFTRLILLCTILLLGISIGLQSQVIALQYRHVPPEHEEEFLHREINYWSKVAEKAIADGRMLNWELWQRVGGWDIDEDASNYVFVNVFEKATDMDNLNEIWSSVPELFPNSRMSDMETNSLSTVKSSLIMYGHGTLGRTGNYAVVNYSMTKDVSKFLEFETQSWQPFLKNAMDMGKTNFVGWSVLTLGFPRGSAVPFNTISVDQYDKMSDAITPFIDDSLTAPEMTGYLENTERKYIGIYSLVAKAEN